MPNGRLKQPRINIGTADNADHRDAVRLTNLTGSRIFLKPDPSKTLLLPLSELIFFL